MSKKISPRHKEPMPKRPIWIIMYRGCDGWLATFDHQAVWKTKAAAVRKIDSLGEKRRMYKPFKFVPV